MSERARALAVALALTFCLVAGSSPRIVGDGGEYLAQAMNFAAFNAPSLGRRAIQTIEARIRAMEPALSEWDIEAATVASGDRRRDFLHFWFYAFVATPALWLVEAIGVSPIHAFTITNVLFVAGAVWVLLPRIGAAFTALVLGGPLVWWFDKAHTEVFTVCLLAIALALVRDRPGWSLVAAGMASTQNLPVAVVFGLIAGLQIVRSRGRVLTDKGWLVAAGIGAGLALLHPVYTYLRHGTPSLLLYATREGFPTAAEMAAPLLDPTMGLVGNAPVFVAAIVMAGAIVLARGWVTPEIGVAAASACLFLVSAAQTSNTHHGATPSLTRYALWLLPLSVPVFVAVRNRAGMAARAALATLAVISSATSVVAFHPGVPQLGREPTTLATWLWTKQPTWQNPLPEVFSEIATGTEGTIVPAATAGCEKVLLSSGATEDGVWPVPCYPAELKPPCSARDSICYANRAGRGYVFVRAPGREGPPAHDRDAAWPPAAEPHVRHIFDTWGWWDLARAPGTIQALRATTDLRAREFGTDERFLVVLRRTGPGAVVRLRPLTPRLVGRLYDAVTGETLTSLTFTGAAGELWDIPLPASSNLAVLALTTGEPPE